MSLYNALHGICCVPDVDELASQRSMLILRFFTRLLRSQLVKQPDFIGRPCISCTPPKVSGPSLALAYPAGELDLRGWPCGKWPALAGSETINKRFGVAKKPAVPMRSAMLVHAHRFVAFYKEFASI